MTLPFTTIGAIVIVSPLREVAHLRAPEQLARRRVDGDGVSVEQVVEDLPVGVRGAAIHDVAAREPDGRLRVLRADLPLERLALLSRGRARSATLGYGVTTYIVLSDDERLSLVAAQHAGGERPRGVQVLRVGRRDLRELAVARARVVAGGHLPFAGRAVCGAAMRVPATDVAAPVAFAVPVLSARAVGWLPCLCRRPRPRQ